MADMIGGFMFNGTSNQTFDLIGKSVKRPLLPPAKVKRAELPSASGVYDLDDLEYGLRTISMRLMYIGKNYHELRERGRRIAQWLSVPNWAKLILDDEKHLYYLAKVTNELDLQTFWEMGYMDVTFDCQPFAYSVEEESSSEGIFFNPGTKAIDFKSPPGSKFLITASVFSGSAYFSMNERSLSYSGPNGNLVIDNVNMTATIDGENAFQYLSGDVDLFLKLKYEFNVFSHAGASNVTVSWIPMWL